MRVTRTKNKECPEFKVHARCWTMSLEKEEIVKLLKELVRVLGPDDLLDIDLPCPMHMVEKHGGEAEKLRAGVEKLIEGGADPDDPNAVAWMGNELQRLLDEVDARDSLAYVEHRQETLSKYGANLRWIRKQFGRSVGDIARALNVSTAHVLDIERGRKEITDQDIGLWARALEQTTADLRKFMKGAKKNEQKKPAQRVSKKAHGSRKTR